MNERTTTFVRDEESQLAQRTDAYLRDEYALAGVSVYAQWLIGIALYLFSRVSTPGYMSVLLSGAAMTGIWALSRFLQRNADPEKGVLRAYLGRFGEKAAAAALAMCFLTDAQLAFFTLCAVMSEVLPDVNTLWAALATALLTAFALKGEPFALPRLSRVLRWVLLLFMAWPVIAALPQGNIGHLSPVLGMGAGNILSGGLWLCGCAAGACCPWLLPQSADTGKAMQSGKRKGLGSLLGGLFFSALFALLAAYLLPFYALARPETAGWRLLIFSTLSPSLIGWSLMLWAVLFFLLLALSAGTSRAALLITSAAGREKPSSLLTAVLLLMQVPLSALNTDQSEDILLRLAPFRAVIVAAVLIALLAGYCIKTRRKGAAA